MTLHQLPGRLEGVHAFAELADEGSHCRSLSASGAEGAIKNLPTGRAAARNPENKYEDPPSYTQQAKDGCKRMSELKENRRHDVKKKTIGTSAKEISENMMYIYTYIYHKSLPTLTLRPAEMPNASVTKLPLCSISCRATSSTAGPTLKLTISSTYPCVP